MLRDAGADERQFTLREAKTRRRGVFNRLSRITRATQRKCYAGLRNRPGNHHLRDRSLMGGRHRFQHPINRAIFWRFAWLKRGFP